MTQPAEPAMLAMHSVDVRWPGGVTALRHVSVAFRRGELTILLGPSGAGKSTLLRTLNGLVTPSSGRVSSGDLDNALAPGNLRAHRRRTAMVFQQHHLIGRVTALDNVLTGRLGYHSGWRTLFPWSRADRVLGLEMLDRVGLLDCANRRADALSGGQQQRVGIARALAQRPAILLADEPVASLDPVSGEAVMRLLRDLVRDLGITAIVSLHQVPFALAFGDRVIGLAAGEVILDIAAASASAEDIGRVYASRSAAPHAPSGISHHGGITDELQVNPA